MRISAKGRYGLAAAICMAENYSSGEYITVISISEKLGISKIYLEQVFSLLKRGGIVNSVKGAQGGYQLARNPRQLTVYDVLSAVELSLFEPVEETVQSKAPEIEAAMRTAVFDAIDGAVRTALEKITLADLVTEVEKQKADQGFMFFI
jgi:transcriptional regulator, BadM/Rrf2 family